MITENSRLTSGSLNWSCAECPVAYISCILRINPSFKRFKSLTACLGNVKGLTMNKRFLPHLNFTQFVGLLAESVHYKNMMWYDFQWDNSPLETKGNRSLQLKVTVQPSTKAKPIPQSLIKGTEIKIML